MLELVLAAIPVGPMLLAAAVGVVLAVLLSFLIRPRRPRRLRETCSACGKPMDASWRSCPFCGHAPPPPAAEVEFVAGPLAGQVFPLVADITTIGSVAGNSIVLPDPEVSKKHLAIRRDADGSPNRVPNGVSGYELADLGSVNGVFVNGQRMAKRLLTTGDLIRLGTSEMVFRTVKVG